MRLAPRVPHDVSYWHELLWALAARMKNRAVAAANRIAPMNVCLGQHLWA